MISTTISYPHEAPAVLAVDSMVKSIGAAVGDHAL
jgi:hypothetical protein